MNKRRRWLMFVVATLLAGAPWAMYWVNRSSRQVDPKRIIEAVQGFCRDQRTTGKAIPENIALRELVASGYLKAGDVRAFDGIEVTIYTTGDETRPQSVLIRARLPDGTEMLGLADGSTAQVTGKALPRAAKP
jgi:hypothetical protein